MNSLRTPSSKKTKCADCFSQNFQAWAVAAPPEILVVEDGSGLFAQIGAMLQSRGFQVVLAPDADTAMQDIDNYHIEAVIAGASKDYWSGLDVLAAVKEKRAGIKTLVVTSLDDPGLPLSAYEMDLDDYLHWPLSGPALTARLRGLLNLEPEPGQVAASLEEGAAAAGPAHTLHILTFLVDKFTDSLAAISQSLEELRQAHREGMAVELSADLIALAADVQHLSDKMRQVWHLQTDAAASPPAAPTPCFH